MIRRRIVGWSILTAIAILAVLMPLLMFKLSVAF